jgi:hypothetical protein
MPWLAVSSRLWAACRCLTGQGSAPIAGLYLHQPSAVISVPVPMVLLNRTIADAE